MKIYTLDMTPKSMPIYLFAGGLLVVLAIGSAYWLGTKHVSEVESSEQVQATSTLATTSATSIEKAVEPEEETPAFMTPDPTGPMVYGGYVNIGLVGPKTSEIQATYVDEHGYLTPAKDYIWMYINQSNDHVWIHCREGYRIGEPESSTGNRVSVDVQMNGVSASLNETFNNKVTFKCFRNTN